MEVGSGGKWGEVGGEVGVGGVPLKRNRRQKRSLQGTSRKLRSTFEEKSPSGIKSPVWG